MRYELKPLGVGGILDQTIRIVKDRFGLFLAIVFCLRIPATAVLQYLSATNLQQMPRTPTDAQVNEFFAHMGRFYLYVSAAGGVDRFVDHLAADQRRSDLCDLTDLSRRSADVLGGRTGGAAALLRVRVDVDLVYGAFSVRPGLLRAAGHPGPVSLYAVYDGHSAGTGVGHAGPQPQQRLDEISRKLELPEPVPVVRRDFHGSGGSERRRLLDPAAAPASFGHRGSGVAHLRVRRGRAGRVLLFMPVQQRRVRPLAFARIVAETPAEQPALSQG